MVVFSMPEVHIGKDVFDWWSYVWTDKAATLWLSRRANRGC